MNIFNDNLPACESFIDVIEDTNGNLVFLAKVFQRSRTIVCTFNSSGIMNSSFGDNGFYQRYDLIPQRILQNGNKYLIGGYLLGDYSVMSLNKEGTLDMNFNNTGEFKFGGFNLMDMKLQTPEKLILGGSSNHNFAVARLSIPYETSVKQYPSFHSSIFPNPAKDYLYFNSDNSLKLWIYKAEYC